VYTLPPNAEKGDIKETLTTRFFLFMLDFVVLVKIYSALRAFAAGTEALLISYLKMNASLTPSNNKLFVGEKCYLN